MNTKITAKDLTLKLLTDEFSEGYCGVTHGEEVVPQPLEPMTDEFRAEIIRKYANSKDLPKDLERVVSYTDGVVLGLFDKDGILVGQIEYEGYEEGDPMSTCYQDAEAVVELVQHYIDRKKPCPTCGHPSMYADEGFID